MKISKWLAATTLLFAVGGLAHAQGNLAKVDKGTTEYDIAGNIHFNKPTEQDIELEYAPFINQNWQWGIEFDLTHAQDVHPNTFGDVEGIVNYYFRNASMGGDTLPFLGVGVGTTYGEGHGLNRTDWGFQGGVKHFLTPNVALFGELNWRHTNKSIAGLNRSNTNLEFGLAFFK